MTIFDVYAVLLTHSRHQCLKGYYLGALVFLARTFCFNRLTLSTLACLSFDLPQSLFQLIEFRMQSANLRKYGHNKTEYRKISKFLRIFSISLGVFDFEY